MAIKYINCNLCGQNSFTVLETDEIYQVVKCKNCKLIYVNPQPDKTLLFEHYNQKYFDPWLKEQFTAREKMWKKRLKKVQALKKAGRLLDVGCGTGLFLSQAINSGWDVYGTEVSGFAVDYIKNKFGIGVLKGKLRDAKFPDNFFDVVTFWHVLEHTADPLGNLTEARRILKPGGVVVIAVPNAHNIIYKTIYMLIKLRKLRLFSINDREKHLYYFSTGTLKKIIEKANLIPVKLDADKERIILGERIIDTFAWIVYKILKVNFGMAIEVYARK